MLPGKSGNSPTGLGLLSRFSEALASVFSENVGLSDMGQSGRSWDLNGDIVFQKNEADNWWLTTKGVGLSICT